MSEQFPMDETSFSGTWELPCLNFDSTETLDMNELDIDDLNIDEFDMEVPLTLEQVLSTDPSTSFPPISNGGVFESFEYTGHEYIPMLHSDSSMFQSSPFSWNTLGNIGPYPSDCPSMTSSMEVGLSPIDLASSPSVTEYHPTPSQWPAIDMQQTLSQLDHNMTVQCSPNSSSNGGEKKGFCCKAPLCGRRYSNNRDLDRHYISNHPAVAKSLGKEKPKTKCTHCSKTFARTDHYTRHLRNKHGYPRRGPTRRH